MRSPTLALALAALTAPTVARGDPPPPPKVCVVVAGDPDDAVRGAASRLAADVAARTDVRGVADEGARAALRGEARDDASLAPLAAARRELDGTEADARPLGLIAERLGCAVAVELAARPAGLRVRAFDAVHRALLAPHEPADVAADAVDRYVLPAARAAVAPVVAPAAPAPPREPARAAAVARAPAPAVDPRVAPNAPAARPPGVAPWIVAGGVAAALVIGFLVLQNAGPGAPVIQVVHPPSGSSP